ncbi:gliding motility-associated C-terminal domain-containing protein, partial [Flavobacterium piscis]
YAVDGGAFAPLASATFDVTAGTHTVVARDAVSLCTSATATSGSVNATPVVPADPTLTIAQPTCGVSGTLTIDNYTNTTQYSVDGGAFAVLPAGTFAVTAGTHTVVARDAVSLCTSATATSGPVNATPVIPADPTLSIAQPTCGVSGTLTIDNYTNTIQYSVDGGVFAVLPAGTFDAAAGTHTVVARDAVSLCTSATATSGSVNATPVVPADPTLSIAQPTCGVSGTLTITNYNAATEYSVDGGAFAVLPAGTFDVTAGTHTVVARDAVSLCTSAMATSASINATPVVPADPTLSIAQPTCGVSGTLTIDNYTNTIQYSVDGGVFAVLPDGTFDVTAGTHTVVARDAVSLCTSAMATSGPVNATPVVPADPIISSVIQPTCNITTGSFTISNYDVANIYNITPIGATLDTTTGIVVAEVGTYNLIATMNGCSSVSSSVVINSKVCAEDDNTFATQTTAASPVTVGNVTDNDTLNGLAVAGSNTDVTPITTGPLSIDANGVLTLAANTVSGTYSIVYQLCVSGAVPSNCDDATATVVVSNPVILAVNDGLVAIDGINGSLDFINILDNDLLDGIAINPADVNIYIVPTNPYFEFNQDGTVSVKPNTPGGDYTFTYQICEKNDPSNCDSATLNVFVEVPAIAIIKTATFNDEDNSGYANAGETITYNFTITNTGNVPLYGVTVTDNLPGVVVSGQSINLQAGETDNNTFTALYIISQNDINKGSVSNQAVVTGQSAMGVVVEDKSDNQNNIEDNPTVLGISGCVIKAFNAVSPNNDGLNDEFNIRGIECYPDNTVEIYNRWGVLVFAKDDYDNVNGTFKGISEGRTTIKQSEKLPVGTYFYILKYKDSDAKQHESAGYLYLSN